MFIMFPDLSSVIKGRETAIAANQNDIAQYNAAQAAQINNLLSAATFAPRVNTAYSQSDQSRATADRSMMRRDVEGAQYPGAIASANAQSQWYLQNADQYANSVLGSALNAANLYNTRLTQAIANPYGQSLFGNVPMSSSTREAAPGYNFGNGGQPNTLLDDTAKARVPGQVQPNEVLVDGQIPGAVDVAPSITQQIADGVRNLFPGTTEEALEDTRRKQERFLEQYPTVNDPSFGTIPMPNIGILDWFKGVFNTPQQQNVPAQPTAPQTFIGQLPPMRREEFIQAYNLGEDVFNTLGSANSVTMPNGLKMTRVNYEGVERILVVDPLGNYFYIDESAVQ